MRQYSHTEYVRVNSIFYIHIQYGGHLGYTYSVLRRGGGGVGACLKAEFSMRHKVKFRRWIILF
jgi:hypothetical protein